MFMKPQIRQLSALRLTVSGTAGYGNDRQSLRHPLYSRQSVCCLCPHTVIVNSLVVPFVFKHSSADVKHNLNSCHLHERQTCSISRHMFSVKPLLFEVAALNFSARYYSKDGNNEGNDENFKRMNESYHKNDSLMSDKNDKRMHDDPWVKSLLADIRQDFNIEKASSNESSSSDDSSSSSDSDDSEPANAAHNSNDNNNNNLQQEEDYEYDYRYADDIEEYGYYDENFEETRPEKILPISLNRGENGVFELDELTNLLEHLGADNVVSFPIPGEANYCDHMIVVTAKSKRHLQALNDELLWVHKRKKYNKDPVLHIEGVNKSEWCAMDMGNLVLHIFMNEELRQRYDIESLWILGPENDPKCNEEDQNSYAVSAEDLFWLEVNNSKEPKVDEEKKD